MVKVTQVQNLEVGELKEWFISLQNQIQSIGLVIEPKEKTEYLSRKEVSKMLGVSLVTVSDWTKKGLLKSWKIGNRIFYKRHEVENSLTEIKHQ